MRSQVVVSLAVTLGGFCCLSFDGGGVCFVLWFCCCCFVVVVVVFVCVFLGCFFGWGG